MTLAFCQFLGRHIWVVGLVAAVPTMVLKGIL